MTKAEFGKKKGRYYKSLRAYENANGRTEKAVRNCPCIHVSGSVKGMRRQFWGYECDVVRIGSYIYKVD